jgi:hypothetical protein
MIKKAESLYRSQSSGGGPAPDALALMEKLGSSGINHKLLFDNVDGEASGKTYIVTPALIFQLY